MSAPLSLTTFANQSPNWQLLLLDQNFAALNNALASIVTASTFPGNITGAITASTTFNYVSVGPINWIYLNATNSATAISVGGLIKITGLPQLLWPSVELIVTGGQLVNNGSGSYLAGVEIDPTGLITVGVAQVAPNPANGILPVATSGFAPGSLGGLPSGFAFSFPTV